MKNPLNVIMDITTKARNAKGVAFRITKETRWDNSEWPKWLHIAWQKEHDEIGSLYPVSQEGRKGRSSSDELYLNTEEGVKKVNLGDYIYCFESSADLFSKLIVCPSALFDEKFIPVT